MTYQAGASRYAPIDELLEQPRVRVLRILRHFDTATANDIMLVARETHELAYQAFNRALCILTERGHVERLGSIPFHYRITEAGRAELARTLAKSAVTEGRTH